MRKIEPIVFKQGAWSKHVPFAYELIRELKPAIFAELGSHKGESYFAFCQSVKDHNLATICYAVDTWQGDEHAGKYGDEVFDQVSEINEKNFGNFSYLIRSTFEDAAKNFSNDSIQLLHIDGFHTYEAVKGDFLGWKDKVSDDGVILFHDIMVRHGDFGVWKFWEELKKEYVTFEFTHGYGLGVLFKNANTLKSKGELFELMLARTEESSAKVHDYFRAYYKDLDEDFRLKTLEIENKDLRAQLEKLHLEFNQLNELHQQQQVKIQRIKNHFLFPVLKMFYKSSV